MRITLLVAVGLTLGLLFACAETNVHTPAVGHRDTQAYDDYEPLAELDREPITESDPYATDPLVNPDALEVVADTAEPDMPPAEPREPMSPAAVHGVHRDDAGTAGAEKGQRIHVVARGDTFYDLAREYYGDATKWRVIWEANQDRVAAVDRLKVGTRLIIPDLQ